jgi:lipoate-protein ligase A
MTWRLLDSGAGSPAFNMALDEAILELFTEASSPVLRLYQWEPAAISLGRFQPLAEVASVPDAVPRVRRITGGGALHHRQDELTYSIVAPYRAFEGRRASPKVAYRIVHDAIASGLASLGLTLAPGVPGEVCADGPCAPLCYDRATDFDLTAGTRKLVGSAQRRRGPAFLQHGSIPVSRDPYSRGAVSLEELLGRAPSREELALALTRGFERSLGIALVAGDATAPELAAAERLARERYATPAWTHDR